MSDPTDLVRAAEDFAAQGIALIQALDRLGVPEPEEIYPIMTEITTATQSISHLLARVQSWFGERDNLVRLGELQAEDVDRGGKYTEVRQALDKAAASARQHGRDAVEAEEAYLHIYPAS